MLSIFVRIAVAERMAAWQQSPRRLHWAWRVLLWPVAVATGRVLDPGQSHGAAPAGAPDQGRSGLTG
jgi:hypothetical protein